MKNKNPIAKELRTPKYKQKIIEDKTKYTRKEKFKNKYVRETDNKTPIK